MPRFVRSPYDRKLYLNSIRSPRQEELGYNDMTTYCESVCGSCDECPCFSTFCNGDRNTRAWSGNHEFIEEVYYAGLREDAIYHGYEVDTALI